MAYPLAQNPNTQMALPGAGLAEGVPQQMPEPVDNEKITLLLNELVVKAEKEDEDLRYNLIKKWKRNDFYFNNIQKIFFDEVARDFKTVDQAVDTMVDITGIDDIKTINVYRAYAESIIAALSVAPPSTEFTPDDAEDMDDVETAQTYTKIAEIIQLRNDAPLMLIKTLTLLHNCGVVAGYSYYKEDPAYGSIKTANQFKTTAKPVVDARCVNCGEMLHQGVDQNQVPPVANCPQCNTQAPMEMTQKLEFSREAVGWEETPKGRAEFDVFGPTNIKMPLYARNQAAMGYLVLRIEDHIARWKTIYKDHAEDLSPGGGDTYSYERWGRIPPEYYGTIPTDITTARFAWIRPWWYNNLDKEDADLLTQQFPEGVMVTIIGDVVVDVIPEKLDDKWTVSFDPRANFIHAEAPGNAIIPLQDAETDVFNLGLQSIQYGIPETFVHPKTVNLNKYSQRAAAVGVLTAALPPGPDKALSDGFHTIKTATLSGEYSTFDRGLTDKTQFVSSAFPSIFGGTPQTGSKTAAEYSQSRNQALQRLQLVWKVVAHFWPKMIYKCTLMYAQNLREDEKFSQKKNGTYVNVWIRKSSLSGKVGHVSPETNEQIPQSWAQKKDFIMHLMEMNVPQVASILLHPSNTELLKEITGMPDFYIPGEADRNKQYAEFYVLSQGGQVPIDVDVDDHMVHMQVLKNIMVSPQGTSLYLESPELYQNCINHYRQHELAQQAKTIAPSGGTMANEPAPSATSTSQG